MFATNEAREHPEDAGMIATPRANVGTDELMNREHRRCGFMRHNRLHKIASPKLIYISFFSFPHVARGVSNNLAASGCSAAKCRDVFINVPSVNY